jgi:hypothetical protein
MVAPDPRHNASAKINQVDTVSLVTGGNRGIGREVCRQLAKLGHTVVLTARSQDAADTAAKAVGAEPLRLDVTDPHAMARAASRVGDRYGRLDVLVNNAAISYDTWQRAVTGDLAVVREARGRTPPRQYPGQRRVPRLGRDRHGRPGRPYGDRRRGQRGVGGDPSPPSPLTSTPAGQRSHLSRAPTDMSRAPTENPSEMRPLPSATA